MPSRESRYVTLLHIANAGKAQQCDAGRAFSSHQMSFSSLSHRCPLTLLQRGLLLEQLQS